MSPWVFNTEPHGKREARRAWNILRCASFASWNAQLRRNDPAPLTDKNRSAIRDTVRPPPAGLSRLGWHAPALLWAVSAIGSGSVLFTPRIAARYEYELFWIAPLTCLFMWALIRESARFAIVTGRTMLDGFADLPGPRGWALWVIFLPQLLAAAVGVAGLSALVGSALSASAGGPNELWTLGFLAFSTALVLFGGYDGVRRIAVFLAVVLVGLAVAAAASVAPAPAEALAGLRPQIPDDYDAGFVLPWIGTILAGSMGIIWFSYWTATHGYGGRSALSREHHEKPGEAAEKPRDARAMLRRWLGLSSRAAALGVLAGLIVIAAFTVLGAELLAPEGTIPEGEAVAAELAALFEGVWGRAGFWAMIVLSIAALGGSVLANQDGWGRSFADIAVILYPEERRPRWASRRALQKLFVATVTGLAPAALYLAVRDPVAIMSASGVIGAAHTPFIAALILFANRRALPKGLRPGPLSTGLLALAGLYYLALSVMRFAGGGF